MCRRTNNNKGVAYKLAPQQAEHRAINSRMLSKYVTNYKI